MDWFQKKQILVPFDFSDESMSAVQVGHMLSASPSELHILHVIPPLVATDPGVIWEAVNDEDRKRHAREAMVEVLQKEDLPVDDLSLNVTVGDPGHAIIDWAKDIGAGLIVLPSHGRTGVKRVILGSVAERVVRHAHCPVLVLKK